MKKHLINVAGVAISGLLLWITLRNYNLSEINKVLVSADPRFLVAAIALILPSFMVRAYRWQFLFPASVQPSRRSLFSAMMVGYLANNLLPARGGELVRAYMLGRSEGISKGLVFATVLIERVIDLLVTLLLLATVIWIFPFPIWLVNGGVIIGSITFTTLAFLVCLNYAGARFITQLKSLLGPKLTAGKVVIRIENVLLQFIDGMGVLRRQDSVSAYLLCTAVIFTIEISIVWLVANSFGLLLPFTGALFVMLVIGIGSIIPSSPGNIGTFEFFATSSMGLLGLSGGAVLGFSVVQHALVFIGASLIGAVCLYKSGLKFLSEIKSMKIAETSDING